MVIETERLASINKAIEGLRTQGLPESTIAGLESWRDVQIAKDPPRELTDSDLAELCLLGKQLNAALDASFIVQFNERIFSISEETGLHILEIKKRAREYRDKKEKEEKG